MSRRTVLVVLVVLAVLAAVAVPAGLAIKHARDRDAQRRAAEAFATAWQSGRLGQLSYAGVAATSVATRTQQITAALTSAATDLPGSVTVRSISSQSADHIVTAALQVTWNLDGSRWSYSTELPLRRDAGAWRAIWSPQVVAPKITGSQVLRLTRVAARRGEILGAGNQVLVTERPVVLVGLEPNRTKDLKGSAQQLAEILDVDGAALARRAAAAKPTAFVDVITLREQAYDALKARLQPIPGAVFQRSQLALAPTTGFARALLGSVGSATAEVVRESHGRVRATDTVGLSGVQHTYDAWLAGTAGLTVTAVDPAKPSTDPVPVFQVPAVAGKALQLSLDSRIQQAAEAALQAAPRPAGLVAVRVSTGDVLAVANGGPNAAGYDRALLGQYPPGSTFKIVTTLALLGSGVTPDSTINCPSNVVVDGKKFTNAEGEVLGPAPFRTDFAKSCNTAFVGSADRITAGQLASAARSLGYGAAPALGVTAFAGSAPASSDPVEHAASMIGQGPVLASPLTVAGTSAAIAAGRYRPPRLVLDPAAVASSGSAAGSTAGSPSLPAARVAALRGLMRSVVTSGTGTALKSVPGGPVYGKTGTAEFGSDDPPQTHAWFTGYQGDIAFAVVVEGGGFGATTAAPLVAAFLTRLAAG